MIENTSGQIGMFDITIVDAFSGAGGASLGMELATGHPVDVAINHNVSAILMHKRNHPYTEHYREDIRMLDPKEVMRGRPVHLAWFSPDCKHFSRAKGAALVDRNIRGLAWMVLRWAGTVRPDVIIVENVPEFVTWGPVRKGKPVKKKVGQTYQQWYSQLEALGYKIETWELCAADYGTPTIRTRFVLVARCDGKPIVKPVRTHAPRNSAEVRSGKLLPWRPAAEIIDWTQPCYSIFESAEAIKAKYGATVRRPLKPNTMRRTARGLDKFVIKSGEPFIIECNHDTDRLYDINEPLNTVTAKYSGGIIQPVFAPYVMSNNSNNAPHSIVDPVPTLTTGNRDYLCGASLIQYHTEKKNESARGQSVREPIMTLDGANRYGLASMYMTKYHGMGENVVSMRDPLPTVTTKDRETITAAYMNKFYTGVDVADMRDPLPTVTAVDHNALTLAHLAHFKGQDKGQSIRDPLMTVTAADGQFGLIKTRIVKCNGTTDLHHWAEVRAMLNEYCGYNLADDEVLLLNIGGDWYFIADIGLRMLTPREMYDAMGCPKDYIIDVYPDGTPIKRAEQVARCGNMVCPPLAEAIVRANLPDMCTKKRIGSMDVLRDRFVS